ncbi:MAG: LysM peptidoglycan-binding domain-containing protein [Clostridia bacterium]|jgi:LysM repeat protein|nr:LysM peptidoglycan-binding domain-containing protein [Clostridia bacterium]
MFLYIVQSDDTLAKISEHFAVSLETIRELNHLENEQDLIPGIILVIPDKTN